MHGLVFLVYDKSLKLSLLPIIPWCNTIRFGNFKFVIFKVVIPDTQAPCVSNSYTVKYWHFGTLLFKCISGQEYL